MIEVNGLDFAYPGAKEPAVSNLEFRVEDGEIFGFLGPKGAGKTTALRLALGFCRPTSGSVWQTTGRRSVRFSC